MLKKLLSTLLLVVVNGNMPALAQKTGNYTFEDIAKFEKAAKSDHAFYKRTGAGENINITYHRLEWEIDPNVQYIKGAVTTYFKAKQDNLSQVSFELDQNLSVDSILYGENKLTFNHSGNDQLGITLQNTLNIGEADSLIIYYQGAPELILGTVNSFTQTNHPGGPIIYTLSEPYGSKDWWPGKVDLGDKIDSVDIFVKTPQAYRAASNGILESENTINGFTTYHWKHNYPITTYLIGIAVTNYEVYSDFVEVNGKNLEILNYVYPQQLSDAKQNTPVTGDLIKLFSNLFGEYPFIDEKYGHAMFEFSGGLEHQTMSFMKNFSFQLVAHELAHQWFGNRVTCASWQDIWLNEGFATYLEGLSYENGYGDVDFLDWVGNIIDAVTSQPGGSVFVDDTTSVGRIFSGRLTYAKGGMVLHMLRGVVGDDKFFKGVKNYLTDSDLSFGYAKTEDLQEQMELVSGKDLSGFFKDWIYGEGYPIYEFDYQLKGDNKYDLTVTQTTSSSNVDFFEMPLPFQLKLASGKDTTLIFDHTLSGQTFTIDLGEPVLTIQFDPKRWILTRPTSVTGIPDENVLKTIKVFPNPVNGHINIQFDPGLFKMTNVRIFDINGREINNISLLTTPNATLEANVSRLSPGIYLIQLEAANGIVNKRFIKN